MAATQAPTASGVGNKRSRTAIVIASAVLLFAVAPAPPTTAHTASPSHWNANCSSGNTSYNAQGYVYRPLSGSAQYKAVRADITVRDLLSCANPTSTKNGWSLVNVVNGARWASGNLTQFVQFGFAEQACATGYCQDSFSNGVTDWWYTLDDNSTPFGVIYEGDWVDFDNDGDHDSYDMPITGDTYELSITYMTTPCSCWRLRIWNHWGQTDYKDITRTSGTNAYFTDIHWGFEIHNDASGFGHKDTASSFNEWPLQYMFHNGSLWSTLTDDTMPCEWQVTGPYPAPDHWGSEHCDITTPNGQTHIDAWQALHT